MIDRLRQILEMIRFSHTLFALPFALLAAAMAWTVPPHVAFRWRDLLGILLCMVFARSAAMAFNRIADRRLDAVNPRTAGRHLPTGRLTVASVAVFTAISSGGFVVATLCFLPNWLPLACSVPVLLFLLAYSLSKRFTALSHFWLGASLMLAPLAAWVAIRGPILLGDPLDALPAGLLALGVLLWVAGFDVIYACQDATFDAQAGLRSLPVKLGVPGALRLAAACHFAMVGALIALALLCPRLELGWIYGAGVLAVAVLLVYEHWLVSPQDLTRVNVAFFQVNVFVSIGLLLVGLIDLLT